jgi:hypothetical protein
MVVRLNLESDSQSISYGDYAGVFTRTLQYVRAGRGQLPKERPRVFVGAMLAPQRADDAEFRESGLAREHRHYSIVFLGGDTVLCD